MSTLGDTQEELDQWKAACRALAPEINTPEDIEGWLCNVSEVANLLPDDIKKVGWAQSPLEGIGTLINDRDAWRSLLAGLIRLTNEEGKNGFSVTLKYESSQDFARVIDANGSTIAEDSGFDEDRDPATQPDEQFLRAIVKATGAAEPETELPP